MYIYSAQRRTHTYAHTRNARARAPMLVLRCSTRRHSSAYVHTPILGGCECARVLMCCAYTHTYTRGSPGG